MINFDGMLFNTRSDILLFFGKKMLMERKWDFRIFAEIFILLYNFFLYIMTVYGFYA